MSRLASFCLISGLLIILLAFGIAVSGMPEYTTITEINDNSGVCSNCHQVDINLHFSENTTHIHWIKSELAQIYAQHPEWDIDSTFVAKPEAQIIAERISALLLFIQADDRWGIHAPDYVETILSEIEHSMRKLIAA